MDKTYFVASCTLLGVHLMLTGCGSASKESRPSDLTQEEIREELANMWSAGEYRKLGHELLFTSPSVREMIRKDALRDLVDDSIHPAKRTRSVEVLFALMDPEVIPPLINEMLETRVDSFAHAIAFNFKELAIPELGDMIVAAAAKRHLSPRRSGIIALALRRKPSIRTIDWLTETDSRGDDAIIASISTLAGYGDRSLFARMRQLVEKIEDAESRKLVIEDIERSERNLEKIGPIRTLLTRY